MKKWNYFVACLTMIGFITLFFSFSNEAMVEFDREEGELLIGNEFIRFFHYIGEPSWIISATLLLLLYLAFVRQNYRGMLFVLFTVAGGNLVNHLIKEWVQRVRPDMPDQLTSFSFPSNHAMLGLLYLFTYAYFLTDHHVSRVWRIGVWSSALLLTLLVGLSRMPSSA